jgi:hypothetical protein
MAILKENRPKSRIKLDNIPAKGTHIATCIEVEDLMNFERPTFDDPSKTEIVDLTRFYFGFRVKGGETFVIRSKGFKLSLHEKSALFQFLKNWNGVPPKPGFDTLTMKGAGAQITIEHVLSAKGRTFANIATIAPVMEGLENLVLGADVFAQYLEPLSDEPADDLPF